MRVTQQTPSTSWSRVGSVVRATSPLGSVVTMAVIGQGGVFGELALFDDAARRTATIRALEATETMSLFRDQVAELRRQAPTVDVAIMRLLREEIVRLSERLVEALYLPVEDRVVRRLGDLVEIYRSEASSSVEIPLTQEDVASMAGTTRPTANGVLRRLEESGTIELGRGRILVRDVRAFEQR